MSVNGGIVDASESDGLKVDRKLCLISRDGFEVDLQLTAGQTFHTNKMPDGRYEFREKLTTNFLPRMFAVKNEHLVIAIQRMAQRGMPMDDLMFYVAPFVGERLSTTDLHRMIEQIVNYKPQ
jgi:hypothetical protein